MDSLEAQTDLSGCGFSDADELFERCNKRPRKIVGYFFGVFLEGGRGNRGGGVRCFFFKFGADFDNFFETWIAHHILITLLRRKNYRENPWSIVSLIP